MSGSDFTMDNFTMSIIVKRSTSATPSAHLQINAFSDAGRKDASIMVESRDGYVVFSPEVDRDVVTSSTSSTTDIVHYLFMGGTASTGGAGVNSIKIFRNGVQIGSTNTTDYTSKDLALTANSPDVGFVLGDGRNYIATGEAYSGRIYEYVQYDKALSDFQFNQLNSYYSRKYGL